MSDYNPYTDQTEDLVSIAGTQFRLGHVAHSLGIPAATLAGLREGKLVAVPREHLDRAATLLSVVTVGQVMDGGDRFIEAAGLNPWAVNEGRARREDRIDPWWLVAAQDRTP